MIFFLYTWTSALIIQATEKYSAAMYYECLGPSNSFRSLKSILSFEMTPRPSDHERQFQFENTIRSQILKLKNLSSQLYHGEKEKLDAYWLGTSNPLPNGIEKLPLIVSQWPPEVPSGRIWSNSICNRSILVLPKITHYIERAPQNVRTGRGYASHRGWLSIKVTT